jgi:organic radical activating enzyme
MIFQIKLNTNCKYECYYCNVYDNTKISEPIDFEGLTTVFNQYLSEENEIFIYGGEPFESEQLEELILFLELHPAINEINIQTNGSSINKLDHLRLNKTNYRVSYHPSKIKFKDLLKILNHQKINSISIMSNNHFKYFKIYLKLKKIFNKMDIIYGPIVNNNKPYDGSHIINIPIDDQLLLKNSYHFTKTKTGLTNYEFMKKYGPLIKNKDFKCSIRKEQLEIYNNLIYVCDMDYFNKVNPIRLQDFNRIEYEISNKCLNTNCSFNNQKYIQGLL